MHHYIVVMRDANIWLVGPFETEQHAARYGYANLAPGGEDDPRWQTIELTDGQIAAPLIVREPVAPAAA